MPRGRGVSLPIEDDYATEFKKLQKIVRDQRLMGREIVVVMGLGFVGVVMAAVVADTTSKETGNPAKFVIGMQRPSTRSYWKIHYVNRGISPVEAEDPEVGLLINRCVRDKQTLMATYTYDALVAGRCGGCRRPV